MWRPSASNSTAVAAASETATGGCWAEERDVRRKSSRQDELWYEYSQACRVVFISLVQFQGGQQSAS